MLDKIKIRLGITGDYHDDLLNEYIDDVEAYMTGAGVTADVLASDEAIGCISRGVADLWANGATDGDFSEFFYQRLEQLRSVADDE